MWNDGEKVSFINYGTDQDLDSMSIYATLVENHKSMLCTKFGSREYCFFLRFYVYMYIEKYCFRPEPFLVLLKFIKIIPVKVRKN